MPLLMIIDPKINNHEMYNEYASKAEPIVKSYGGKYLVRGGEIKALSEHWTPERIVIIEWPDQQTMDNCFNSPEYKKIVHLRLNSIVSRSVVVEKCE